MTASEAGMKAKSLREPQAIGAKREAFPTTLVKKASVKAREIRPVPTFPDRSKTRPKKRAFPERPPITRLAAARYRLKTPLISKTMKRSLIWPRF